MKQLFKVAYLLIFCTTLYSCKPNFETVSKDEALKFAEDMEVAANKREDGFLSNRLNIDALTKNINYTEGNEFNKGFKDGMKSSLKKNNLDKEIFTLLGNNGFFEKVKVYEKNKNHHVIFRLYGDGGINYYDLDLVKYNNKVGIADMYIYALGDNFSTVLKELILGFDDEKISKLENDVDKIKSIKKMIAFKKFKDAKDLLDELPEKIKNTKAIDVMNLQICGEIDNDLYIDALQKFEIKYGNDAGSQLLLFDKYLLQNQYTKALKAINIVDSCINKDLFLDYYRGIISRLDGDTDLAISTFEKLVKNKPEFEGAYAELFVQYIEKGNKEKAKQNFALYKKMKRADKTIIDSYAEQYPYLISN